MNFNKKTIADIDPLGKKILMRVDFNAPIEDGKVSDDKRIRAALPSINYLLDHGAALILCSHLGRPAGKVQPEFSLHPLAQHLQTMVDAPVAFVEDCIGPLAEEAAAGLEAGHILLLENTRFHPGEKANSAEMAASLAKLADVYVNDAFGSAHRAHASTEGVAHHLPSVAGLLMEKEIRYLSNALDDPARPFIAILGGAKVSDKIGVIQHLLGKADQILIGGAMANTFFKALGHNMGACLLEEDALHSAKEILDLAGDKLFLPKDLVIAETFAADAAKRTMPIGDIPETWTALDIGLETVIAYSDIIHNAATVVWNGPMGVFEMPAFAKGTFALAAALAASTAQSIVGGGDSASAIQQSGLEDKITHVSTGGGASLALLAGKSLPGVAALQDKDTL